MFENVCETTDFVMELLVSQSPLLTWLAFPNQRRFVATPSGKMTVQAVVGDVQFARGKPLRVRCVPMKNPVPLLEPMQFSVRHPSPERFGIGFSFCTQRFEFSKGLNVRRFAKAGGGGNNLSSCCSDWMLVVGVDIEQILSLRLG